MRLLPLTLVCQLVWSLFMSGLGNYTAEVSGVTVRSFLGDILTAHNLHALSSGCSLNLRRRSYIVDGSIRAGHSTVGSLYFHHVWLPLMVPPAAK